MSSIGEALGALERAVELVGAADLRELDAPERFAAVERLERVLRRVVAISREQLTQLERFEAVRRWTSWWPTCCGSAAGRPNAGYGMPPS